MNKSLRKTGLNRKMFSFVFVLDTEKHVILMANQKNATCHRIIYLQLLTQEGNGQIATHLKQMKQSKLLLSDLTKYTKNENCTEM